MATQNCLMRFVIEDYQHEIQWCVLTCQIDDGNSLATLITILNYWAGLIQGIIAGRILRVGLFRFADLSTLLVKTVYVAGSDVLHGGLFVFEIPTLYHLLIQVPSLDPSLLLADGITIDDSATPVTAFAGLVTSGTGGVRITNGLDDPSAGTMLTSYLCYGLPTDRQSWDMLKAPNADDTYVMDGRGLIDDKTKMTQPWRAKTRGYPTITGGWDILAAPRVELCFNNKFIPYILGLMTSVTDWAGYHGTYGNIAENIQQFLRLVGTINPTCAADVAPTFNYWEATSTTSGQQTWQIEPGGYVALPRHVLDFDDGRLIHNYWHTAFFMQPNFGQPNWNITLIGHDGDGSLAGLNVYYLDIWQVNPLGATLSVQVLDCDGTVHNVAQVDPINFAAIYGITSDPHGIQEIVIGCSSPFGVSIIWKDVECSGA